MKKWLSQTTIRCATLILSLILSVWNFLDGHLLSGWLWLLVAVVWALYIYLDNRKK